ncbi:MAG: hypothetical protein WBB23_11260 [Desulforhopalus sp.]
MTAQYSIERRKFLKTMVIIGGAVASLSGATEVVADGKRMPSLEKSSDGYRETDHIKKYYQSARI